MNFGWSVGDIIAGIKVVWTVYEALSDGPRNSQVEATQFFDEFHQITQCLHHWELQADTQQDETLLKSEKELEDQCQKFVKRHMRLIQDANPHSATTRQGRSTWLRKVTFSSDQVALLYQKVQWPFEREEVARLRNKLFIYLHISTNNAVHDTKQKLADMRILEMANLKLVASHLEVVSSVAHNLKMITTTRETGSLDYSMLRQLENAILPPPPMKAIEATTTEDSLRIQFGTHRQAEDDSYGSMSTSSSSSQEAGLLGQDEIWLRKRLENIAKRGMNGTRAGDLVRSGSSGERRYSVVQPVLQRLRQIRTGLGDAVGIPIEAMANDHLTSTLSDSQKCLREELDMWNQLEERIQYDVKRREQRLNRGPPKPATRPTSIARKPVPSPEIPHQSSLLTSATSSIAIPSPYISPHGSPMSSPQLGLSPSSEGWFGSPNSNSLHNRSSSTSSSSGCNSVFLAHPLSVTLQHQKLTIKGLVKALSKDDNEVCQITTVSLDGLIELRHYIERSALAAKETSMKPFLDNSHVDKTHKYRVLFQGTHVLKGTKRDSQGLYKIERRGPTNPTYTFDTKKDFLEFQYLLLNKEVALFVDVSLISSAKEPQCRLGTIRILVDPISKLRSILYFRSKTKDKPHPAFIEWETNLFKVPKEPTNKCKILVLDSIDGKSLSLSRNALSRRSTQGSVTTIGSLESTTAAHARLQERSSGRSIKSLTVEFYDVADCHDFWKEFIKKEDLFSYLAGAETPS